MAGLNIGGAAGVAQLRSAFRQEGFHAPDVHAQVLSELSNQAFTADQLLAEQDEFAARYLQDIKSHEACWASGPVEAQADMATRPNGMPDRQHRIIEAARRKETVLLPSLEAGIISKPSDIRNVAEEIATANGFIRRSGKSVPRHMSKVYPGTGMEGRLEVDAGSRGSLWSSTNMQFYVSHEGREGRSTSVILFRIVRGIVWYNSAAPPLAEVLSNPTAMRDRDPQLGTDLLKVGILAQVRFFDLLMTRADAWLGERR